MDERQVAAAVERIVRSMTENHSCHSSEPHVCRCGKKKMTLKKAQRLAAAVEAEAKKMGVNAVIAVSDQGGNPVLVHSMDNAYLASWDIAYQKAYTVVALKMSTEKLAELAAPGGSLYGIQFTNNGKIVIFGGGEPLKYEDKIVGGLGVSGGTAEQDTALAAFGKEKFKEINESC